MTKLWAMGCAGLVGCLSLAGCGSTTIPSAATVKSHSGVSGGAAASPSGDGTVRTTAGLRLRQSGASTPTSALAASALARHAAASARVQAWNPVVRQAMAYVGARTSVPLAAPYDVPLPAHSSWYLAATATATTSQYHVHLQLTTTPLGLNSAAIHGPAGGGLANDLGGFGAVRYGSARAAQNALGSVPLLSHPSSPIEEVAVNLGHGIEGQSWAEPASGVVQWHEGEWTLQVNGLAVAQDVALAKTYVAFLHHRLLPETHGVVVVDAAGDGQHTQVFWTQNHVVYRTSDYHHARGAMDMAMSMEPVASKAAAPGTTVAATPAFAGSQVQFYSGKRAPAALPNGYQGALPSLKFSNHTLHRVEGFTGILHGHRFVLDFYQKYPVGLYVGIRYHHHPVYFNYGPSPVFDVLNFTGDQVVLGTPSAGTYVAINLMTGQQTVSLRQLNQLKGYRGLGAPSHILGLPDTHWTVTVPYGPNA